MELPLVVVLACLLLLAYALGHAHGRRQEQESLMRKMFGDDPPQAHQEPECLGNRCFICDRECSGDLCEACQEVHDEAEK